VRSEIHRHELREGGQQMMDEAKIENVMLFVESMKSGDIKKANELSDLIMNDKQVPLEDYIDALNCIVGTSLNWF